MDSHTYEIEDTKVRIVVRQTQLGYGVRVTDTIGMSSGFNTRSNPTQEQICEMLERALQSDSDFAIDVLRVR